jgi:hypothetical protein
MKMDLKNRRLRSEDAEYIVFDSMFQYVKAVDDQKGVHEDVKDIQDDEDRNYVIDQCLDDGSGENSWRFGDDLYKETYTDRFKTLNPREDIVSKIKDEFKQSMNSDGLQHLFQQMVSKRRRREFRDDYGRFSIPRALSGNTDMFVNRKKKTSHGLKIGIKLGLNSGNADNEFIKLVTNLSVAVMMIEAAGIPVELHILFDGEEITSDWKRQGISFIVKGSSERMNINRIALIGNVGMFRYHTFLAWCYFLSGEIRSGLGRNSNKGYKEDAKLLGLDIILGSEFKDNDVESAFNLLTKQIFNKNDKVSQGDVPA